MTATLAPKTKKKFTFDAGKFAAIRNRIADLYLSDGDLIRAKKTVRTTAFVFREMRWMVDEIERLAGGPISDEHKPRYEKVKRFTARVCEDQAAAIAGGAFVKTSAEVFGAMRFLSKCLEEIVRMEDEELLGPTEVMPPENTDRIQIDLEEGIEDTDEETVAQLRAVGSISEDDPAG